MRSPFVALVVIAACGGRSHDAAPDAAGDFTLACESHAAAFPTLDKSCATAADCVVVQHMISCCGTEVAIGLAATSKAAFDSAELACTGGYPGCGCAAQPTAAEDGRNVTMGAIAVRCTEHRCATYVP